VSVKAVAYVDGASRGNPGPASFGVVFHGPDGKPGKKIGAVIGTATNNTAEYFGLIVAMQEALMMGVHELEVFTDSQLVARQFSGEYKIKEPSIRQLCVFVRHLRKGFKKISVTHVPREENKLADAEANRALDEAGQAPLI
jgi:ribonuclease HI